MPELPTVKQGVGAPNHIEHVWRYGLHIRHYKLNLLDVRLPCQSLGPNVHFTAGTANEIMEVDRKIRCGQRQQLVKTTICVDVLLR